jgi:hypothetical protein
MGSSKVSWFRKKKEEAHELTLDELTTEVMSRIRGLYLDAQFKEAFALSVLSGTTMVSDEVAEMEQAASDRRLKRIEHLTPLVLAQTFAIAKSSMELQKTNMSGDLSQVPEEVWSQMVTHNHQMMLGAVLGSISQMVDLRLLSVGPRRPR